MSKLDNTMEKRIRRGNILSLIIIFIAAIWLTATSFNAQGDHGFSSLMVVSIIIIGFSFRMSSVFIKNKVDFGSSRTNALTEIVKIECVASLVLAFISLVVLFVAYKPLNQDINNFNYLNIFKGIDYSIVWQILFVIFNFSMYLAVMLIGTLIGIVKKLFPAKAASVWMIAAILVAADGLPLILKIGATTGGNNVSIIKIAIFLVIAVMAYVSSRFYIKKVDLY